MLVSPQKIRFLFLAKAIIVPPTWLALLVWALVRVPPNGSLLKPKETLSGNDLLWAWLSAFNSAIGFFANLGVNMSNFTVSNCILHNCLYPSDNLTTNSEICEERKGVRDSLLYLCSGTNKAHVIAQSIYSAPSNSCCVHLGQLRRHCSYKRRYLPLRPNYLGPAQAHRPLEQSLLCILRISRICSLYARLEYLSQLFGCRE